MTDQLLADWENRNQEGGLVSTLVRNNRQAGGNHDDGLGDAPEASELRSQAVRVTTSHKRVAPLSLATTTELYSPPHSSYSGGTGAANRLEFTKW